MRYLLVAILIVSAGGDALAKRRARHHHKKHVAARVVHVVHDDAAARQYARAEAELAELRGSSSLPAAAPEPRVHYDQHTDAETPAGLRR